MRKALTLVEKEFVKAILGHVRVEWSFETAGCRCGPLRQQLKEQEAKRKAFFQEKVDAFRSQVNEEFQREFGTDGIVLGANDTYGIVNNLIYNDPSLKKLKADIEAIDVQDHPTADRLAHEARPYFKVWLVSSLLDGTPLPEDPIEVGLMFAKSWMAGWRPLK